MKPLQHILLLGLVATAPAFAGPYAPAAGQPGSTAIAMDSPLFTDWATGYTNYVIGAGVDATWQTPNLALGPAVGTSFDIVGLGNGGSITLSFANPIANGAGADFAVFENSISDNFLELAWVEVSSDGANFFRFGNTSFTAGPVGAFGSVDPTNLDGLAGKYRQGFGTPFDLETLTGTPGLDLAAITQVRLVDIIGDGTAFDTWPAASGGPHVIYDPHPTTGSGGFDLDAVGVIHQAAAVPVPAGLWLLASGLGVLGAFRRRATATNHS